MRAFVKSFVRDPHGVWICLKSASVVIAGQVIERRAGDRILPGERIPDGRDLAELMDQVDLNIPIVDP